MVTLAITVVTARVLGPEGRGVLVALMSWMTALALVAGLSLGEVSQYWIQLNREKDWLPSLLGSLLLCLAALSPLAIAGSIGLYWWGGGAVMRNIPAPIFAIGMLLLPLVIWEQYARYLLLGAGRVRHYNLALVLGGTAGVVAVVGLAGLFELSISGALFGQITGLGITATIALGSLLRATSFRIEFNLAQIGQLISGALKLHLNTIGVLLMAHANILMLNYYSTPDEVAWYQFSLQLIMGMLIIPQAASMILFSRMAAIGADRIWSEQKRLMGQIFILLMVLASVAYFFAPELIILLGGADFEPSAQIFRHLLPVLFGMSFAQLMTPQWVGRGIFFLTSILTVVTGIANVFLNLYLIPAYGMMGAVWSMNFSFFVIVIIVQSLFAGWVERKSRIELTRNG